MIHQFKTGTHVPAGATADGVVAERDLIEQRQGAVTVDAAYAEIQTNPKDFPNIRAFYPASADEAWEVAAKDAIRKAFKSVVIVREKPSPGSDQPRRVEIRQVHAVPSPGGRQYKMLATIRENQKDLSALFKDLKAEADSYYSKFQNVMEEIGAAIDSTS